MYTLRRIYLLLFVTVSSVACKDKTIDVVPAPAPDPGLSWQADNDFLFDEKIQLSSYADSSLIILSGSQTTSIAPGDQRPKSDTSFVHYGGQAQPYGRIDYRPLLTPSLITFLNNDIINIIPSASPVLSYANVLIRMSQVDANFASFNLIPVYAGETMVANQQNQVIIPYQRYDRTYSSPVIDGTSTNFALVSITVPAPPNIPLTEKKMQIITLNGASFLYSLCSVGDYFIASTTSGTFRIAPDGSYQKTYPYGLERQFTFNGTVYGVTNAGGASLQLIASTDQGNTWSTVISQLPDTYRFLIYKQVNNVLIGTYNSQIFQLKFTANTLNTTELDNTGLYGNRITSVAAFRNTVYVSTLSGVFTKPLRTFLTPKKDK